jgi:hypothetical protein
MLPKVFKDHIFYRVNMLGQSDFRKTLQYMLEFVVQVMLFVYL